MDDVPGTVPGGKDTRVPRLVSVPVEVPDRVREGCMAVGKDAVCLALLGREHTCAHQPLRCSHTGLNGVNNSEVC